MRSGLKACPTLAAVLVTFAAGAVSAQQADPRVGLRPGWTDAGVAARGMELVSNTPRPAGFFSQTDIGNFALMNSDLAFSGTTVFQGSFHGFQIWDVSNPAAPRLRVAHACPGGQGDPSVYRNLLFISVEEPRGRVDCGGDAPRDSVSTDRFRGVRIFDITDVDHPRQVAAVQTCRGSHTHTLVPDPRDPESIYVYVSGTAPSRPAGELAGCMSGNPPQDQNSPYFRIEVIKVPLARPQDARVVSSPRVFANPQTGAIAGLNPGGSQGAGAQSVAQTNQCHDITAYPALGIAAGACAGNGILLDISDPANPRRVAEVADPNFAYWHSATFNNAGTTVLFSDEWGGGVAPRCRSTDRPTWGADAIFRRGADNQMRLAGYYKMPAAQTAQENCVAHNGSLIPVPGRDILVQGWYQGGISVIDFTDPSRPVEIAYFDRGPMQANQVAMGGSWGAYWYNGLIYSSELGRGLDILRLVPSEQLSENEIEAAKLVRFDQLNVQSQPKLEWPASFVVARAYLDQLVRYHGVQPATATRIGNQLRAAERARGSGRRSTLNALAATLDREAARAADATRVRALAEVVRHLAH